MTPRQKRLQRKKWRVNFKAYYQRQKQAKRVAHLAENTPSESPIRPNFEDIPLPIELDIRPVASSSSLASPSTSFNKNREPVSPLPGPSRILRSRQNIETSPKSQSETPTIPRSCASSDSSITRRLRYKKDTEISRLKKIILNIKRQNDNFKKQILENQAAPKINILQISN